MTLKQAVRRANFNFSQNRTLCARNKKTDEIYSIVDLTDGIVTLRSEYNAKQVNPITLEELYKGFYGIHEKRLNSFSI